MRTAVRSSYRHLDPTEVPLTFRPMRDFFLEAWAHATTQIGSLFGHGFAGASIFLFVREHPPRTPEEAGVYVVASIFVYREVSDLVQYMAEEKEPPPFEKCADGFTDLWGPVFVAALLAGIITGMA